MWYMVFQLTVGVVINFLDVAMASKKRGREDSFSAVGKPFRCVRNMPLSFLGGKELLAATLETCYWDNLTSTFRCRTKELVIWGLGLAGTGHITMLFLLWCGWCVHAIIIVNTAQIVSSQQ